MRIPLSKQEAREKSRRLLYPPPENGKRLSETICQFIETSEIFRSARRVGLFYPRKHEPELLPLLVGSSKIYAFPRVGGDGVSMAFYSVKSLNQLEEGFKGILEPMGDSQDEIHLWDGDDIILIPGLAFDRSGSRVGSGLGFYDRYLSQPAIRAHKWGVCFSACLFEEKLAQEQSDVRMDAIVTEREFWTIH